MKIPIQSALAGEHDEALNIAGAQAFPELLEVVEFNNKPMVRWRNGPTNIEVLLFNSLDAVAKLEEKLTIDQQYDYGEQLRKLTGNVGPKGGHFAPNGFGCFALATAKSRVRLISVLLIVKPEMFE